MNTLPLRQAASQKRGDSAGGDGIGAVANPPAQPSYTVGEIGFGPTWSDDEPSLRAMYDAACATIIRLECEADELRAEAALLQQQARIITEERDEARVQYQTTHLLAEALVKTIGELKDERVDLRLKVADWRDCAKRLAAAVQYYHPKLRDETEGGWSEERAAIALFDELEASK